MTAISSKPIPAYKTQWDSVAEDIREVTRLGVNVPLCLSYLFPNTVFRGIPELVSYFQENDELYVPANQELAVLDTSVLLHDKEEPVVWMQSNLNRRIASLLDTMISPIGKIFQAIFNALGTANQSLTTGSVFVLQRSIGYTLKAVVGDLDVRFSDLFRLMVTCKIPQLKFGSKQALRVWGIPNNDAFQKMMEARIPEGCRVGLNGVTGYFLEGVCHKVTKCQGVAVTGEELCLTIEDNFSFKSIADFAQRLALREIEVPPNQKLTICDVGIGAIVQSYERFRKIQGPANFLLDQMLLASGYGVEIVSKTEEALFDYKATKAQLEIVFQVGSVLKRVRKSLFVDFSTLGPLMISQRISRLSPAPNQNVLVCGLSERELEEANELFKQKDLIKVMEFFSKALQQRNPLGFSWYYKMKGNIGVCLTTITHETGATVKVLELSSSGEVEFSLHRPSGARFIANIVNISHPELLEGLKEVDSKALKFLLFRAFFYYLCQNREFRSDELPDFFRPEEHRLLVPNAQGRMQAEGVDPVIVVNNGAVCQLIDESTATKIRQKSDNPKIAKAIAEINSSEEILEKVQKIVLMAPREFDDLSLDKLPAPLQVVLKEIRELSNKELSKSPFIHEHLKAFLAELPEDSGDSSTDKKDDVK